MGAIYSSSSRTRSFSRCSNRTRIGPSTAGGTRTTTGGTEPLQCSWGGDETRSKEDQPGAQTDQLREDVDKNPMEDPNNRVAPAAEGEIGVALNATTFEPKGDRAIEMEGNIELVTIESSLEWGGTLIEEEQP